MRAVGHYAKIYPGAAKSIAWRGDSHVISYGPGCHIGVHNDNAIDSGTQNEELIGSVISTSLILSDRCVGGALGFHYLGQEFLPCKGSFFAFPSNFMGAHYITKVISGTRVARLEWFGHGKRTGNFEIVELGQADQ
ncbi:MAG: 2OG-Fe(II) oxygenase [Bacteroidetes bacterium]|nr:2OG-Fe(II) oxygenase [Bacteroidota bacterium]